MNCLILGTIQRFGNQNLKTMMILSILIIRTANNDKRILSRGYS